MLYLFFFIATAATEIYTYLHTLSLHSALPISQVRGGRFDAAGTLVEVGSRGPVVAVGAGEGLERRLRVPAALAGQQVERLVVHALRVVHVHAAGVVVGMADRTAVLRRVGHVAQRAAALEDLRANQEVVAAAVEVVLGGLAGTFRERLVDRK